LSFMGHTFPGYTAVYTLILNLGLAMLLTPVFNRMGSKAAPDATVAADYIG
jgi:solute:Na+ symporter, SSS family